ncbi:MAG: amino acid ABC transporter permease [Trueperaceae bacterium]
MEMIQDRLPPARERGPVAWARRNLFRGPVNTVVSLIVGYLLVVSVTGLLRWIVTDAAWMPVWSNLKLLAAYRYPSDVLWRPILAVGTILMLMGIGTGVARRAGEGQIIAGVFWWFSGLVFFVTLLAVAFWPSVRVPWLIASLMALMGLWLGRTRPTLGRWQNLLWLVGLILVVVLLVGVGGTGPFRVVRTVEWGGFLLTLVLASVGIVVSFPLGVALALGRRSHLPVIKWVCIGVIELVRGAPLITWLFIASLMVPLLLDVSPDAVPALARAMIAVTLFSAAYMAENVRGGLQGVPSGQGEAARALGLSGWQSMRLIVLPQALRSVIPAIVGQSIGLFKDTSLVFIVGLFDFFEIGRRVIPSQPESLQYTGGVLLELSVFMAIVYAFFAFRMSLASRQLEQQLGVGER